MDAALVRPGRLDRHIEIAFPDALARLEIVEQYLGTKISTAAAQDLIAATEEWSGAALEQLARSSRRRARLEGRPVCGDDILACLPDVVALDAERVLTTAVHEAGHVVVGLAVGHVVDRIRLTDRYVRGAKRLDLGGVNFVFEDFPRRTRQTHLDEICVSLAGMIAEEQITGTFDDGVGGSANSDLVRATRLATLLEGVFGMGGSLVAEQCENDRELDLLRFKNPMLQGRVDALLNEQRQRTTEIVIENMPAIEALSRELANRRSMTGDDVKLFLADHEWRIVHPAEHGFDVDDRELKRIVVGERRNHSPFRDRRGNGPDGHHHSE
jgi:ATP-dependent Zn protease